MTKPDFADTLDELSRSAWAYAALAGAVEAGLLDLLRHPIERYEAAAESGIEPAIADEMISVLEALGAVTERDGVLEPTPAFETLNSAGAGQVLRAGVRSDHMQIAELLGRITRGEQSVGWAPGSPREICAQGETSAPIGVLIDALLPKLDGLAARMQEPGARILDVGAGIGVVATELCRMWPEAEAVGLEPHAAARELGRARIAAAGLDERIALRDEVVQELGELNAYDLAFVPQPFVERGALEAGLPRIRRALRPGGWLVVLGHDLSAADGEDPVGDAAHRFRAGVWGGGVIEAPELSALLAAAGFASIRSDYPVGAFRAVCATAPGTKRSGSNGRPAAEILPAHEPEREDHTRAVR
jgi:SAM-dependent methyltransferase